MNDVKAGKQHKKKSEKSVEKDMQEFRLNVEYICLSGK